MSPMRGKSLVMQVIAAASAAAPPRIERSEPSFWIDEFSNLDYKALMPLAMAGRHRGYSSFLPLLQTKLQANRWHLPFVQMPWLVARSLRDLIPEPQVSQRGHLLATTTHTPLPDERKISKWLRHRACWR